MAQIKTKFITDNAVTNAKLAQMGALTLKGNSTGSTANASDLSVSAVQTLLSIPTSSSPLALNAGGTGVSAASANAAFNALSPMTTAGDLIYENGTPVAARLAIGSSGQVLTVSGGFPAWVSPSAAHTQISENITLSGGDITNQYVDLAHPALGASASVNSVSVFIVGGPMQLKTVDYTVSLTGGSGGVTRVSFAGDLATGGNAALVATDILVAEYEY